MNFSDYFNFKDPHVILGKYVIKSNEVCLHNLIFSNPWSQRILLCTGTTPSRVFITAWNPANPVLLG